MGYTDEMIEKAKAAGELSEEELANVAGGGCGNWGDHVRLPGGVCPFCKTENPSGYYRYDIRSHVQTIYYMDNLDCCHQKMELSQSEAQRLVKIN